jgi:hypothetical protein
MIQQAIEMPAPSGADTETVITALETAAVFRARGDRQEAVRWLRRAAESAGEAGDDHRALSLSRAAADLTEELEGSLDQKASPEPARPLPTAPPSLRAARPASASPRPSHPPPPSARGARPSSSPRASYPPRPSSRPSYLSGARPPISTQPPQSSASPSIEATPDVVVHTQPNADAPKPPTLPAESVRPTLAPVTSAPSSEPAPTPSSRAPVSGPARTGARMAARVAVTISTTKAGVLEVRLLADGESPRIGSSEAMLVMLDPSTTLLSR